jgi:hypothetical protein
MLLIVEADGAPAFKNVEQKGKFNGPVVNYRKVKSSYSPSET